jgi:hypothetical protein
MSRNPARRSWLGPGLRQAALVVAMAVAMLLATAVLGARFLGSGPFDTALTLPWWVMAIAFAATEAFVVHRQVQREAQTVSVSEFPLVLGLFFASPLQLLVGRLIGSLVIFLVHRRSSALKVTWNLALFSLQTVLSVVLFRVLTEGQGPSSPLAWLGAYAGAIAANWAGHVAIVLVIAIYEGGLRLRPLLTGMLTEEPAAPVVITLGLLAAISLSAAPCCWATGRMPLWPTATSTWSGCTASPRRSRARRRSTRSSATCSPRPGSCCTRSAQRSPSSPRSAATSRTCGSAPAAG